MRDSTGARRIPSNAGHLTVRPLRLTFAVLAMLIAAKVSAAQPRVMLRGTVDAEAWDTDTSSNLLAKNGGRHAALGRAMLWGAIEPVRSLVFYGLAESEAGSAVEQAHHELEQAGLRYTRSRRFVLDAGKITMPLGGFAARRFSWRNPLVGEPDAYPVLYPYGATISGAASIVDYRAGVVSLPMAHEEYTPDPTHALRPILGIGITPLVGVRLGVGYTWGPYLNDTLTATQLQDGTWDSYEQRVGVADLAVSYGYLELFAEVGHSAYEVPGRAESVEGVAYYAEGKYTFGPRFFAAIRLERNDYPFIQPVSPTFWVARKTDFHNEEIGLGYRVAASTLLKVSYRQDVWQVDGGNAPFVRPGGRAFAMQLSQQFDVLEWF